MFRLFVRQDILAETVKFDLTTFTTSRQEQLNATLCNPTDNSFVMHSLTASAVLDGSELLRANLAHKVRKRSSTEHIKSTLL